MIPSESVTTQALLIVVVLSVNVIPETISLLPSTQNVNGPPSKTPPSHCADSKFVDNTIKVQTDKMPLSSLIEG